MRALLLDAHNFESYIEEASTRPSNIVHDTDDGLAKMQDCMVAFFTLEKEDDESTIDAFFEELLESLKDFGLKKIMIAPFVHLSNNIADPAIAQKLYLLLCNKFKDTEIEVLTSHFGYHKSLLLDIKGHPGSFRYREF